MSLYRVIRMFSSGRLHRSFIYPAVLRLRGEHAMYGVRDELESLQWASQQTLEERQQKNLAELLRHSVRTIPRFRRSPLDAGQSDGELVEAFRDLPPLTKDELQENRESLLSGSVSDRTTEKTTSGSTGEPVTVRKNAAAVAHERAATWMSYGWFGIDVCDPCARFWGSRTALGPARVREWLTSLVANQVRFSAFSFSEDDLERYWQRCLDYRPAYFYGYVSMLTEFARYVESKGYDGAQLDLKAVVSTAEALSDPQRDLIEQTFGAPVQNEYGCGEVGPIAYECPEGGLHVMTPNVLVELLAEDGTPVEPGETGHVHVTDLKNRAMPLIRYRVGDMASWGDECACGRGFPVLDRVFGREYDFVEDESGEKYHGEYFLYLFEELAGSGRRFSKARVIQESRSVLIIEIQSPADFTEKDRTKLKTRIENDMAGMTVQIREVAEISRLASGKSRVIENRWMRSGNPPGS